MVVDVVAKMQRWFFLNPAASALSLHVALCDPDLARAGCVQLPARLPTAVRKHRYPKKGQTFFRWTWPIIQRQSNHSQQHLDIHRRRPQTCCIAQAGIHAAIHTSRHNASHKVRQSIPHPLLAAQFTRLRSRAEPAAISPRKTQKTLARKPSLANIVFPYAEYYEPPAARPTSPASTCVTSRRLLELLATTPGRERTSFFFSHTSRTSIGPIDSILR